MYRLKQQPRQGILVTDTTELVRTLMQYSLIDEYRLMVPPLVPGKGKSLCREGTSVCEVELLHPKVFPRYRRAFLSADRKGYIL